VAVRRRPRAGIYAALLRRVGKVVGIVTLAACATATVGTSAALAQDPGMSIQGRVLRVAAESMIIAPYVPIPGVAPAVNVDLSRARLDEYAELRTGDSVAVTGTVAPEGDRVIATSIRRLNSS
jgi:hypothetical protein